MSSLKRVRRFVGCRQLQGLCGPLVPRRASTASQRNFNDDGHDSSDLEGPRKKPSWASGSVARSEFHQPDKDITVVKNHMAEFKSDAAKEFGKKLGQVFDRIYQGYI